MSVRRLRWPRAVTTCPCGAEVGVSLPPLSARRLTEGRDRAAVVQLVRCVECRRDVRLTVADVLRAGRLAA